MYELVTSIAGNFELFTLAQANLDTLIDEGINKMQAFTVIIAVAGISIGGFLITRGQIEYALYVIVGALVIAGAYPIASSLFEISK